MSSSEELSQCDDNANKSESSISRAEGINSPPAIPRDQFGYFGVHVSNLPSGIAENLLETTFSDAGRVQVCKIVEHSSQPVYAFVKFSFMKEAQEALRWDGYKLMDNVLSVRPAYAVGRFKRNHPSGSRRDPGVTSSERGRFINGRNKKEEYHGVTYTMGSTDCRLKDGKLSDADCVTFNGSTGKSSPPKKSSERRPLAPRFKRDCPPPRFQSSNHCKSTTSDASTEAQEYQDMSAYQMTGTSSPGLRPYQGNFQEPKLQSNGSVENCVMTVTSSFSQLAVSSPDMKNSSPSNQSHENHSLSYQPRGVQGVTSWSGTAAIGMTSNSRDVSVNNQGRNTNVSVQGRNPPAKAGISSWSTSDVVQYFLSTDCAEYAGFFQEQEIDGKALLLLNRDTLLHFMKVGPALKVLQLIDELRSYSSQTVFVANGW